MVLARTYYCKIVSVLRTPKVADSSLSYGGAKHKAAMHRLRASIISEEFDNQGESLILTYMLQKVKAMFRGEG